MAHGDDRHVGANVDVFSDSDICDWRVKDSAVFVDKRSRRDMNSKSIVHLNRGLHKGVRGGDRWILERDFCRNNRLFVFRVVAIRIYDPAIVGQR